LKILILHHVETMWAETMQRMFGVNYDDYLMRVAQHLEESDYDRVQVNMFEGIELEPEHWPIAEKVWFIEEYGYGWEAEMFDEGTEGEEYCEGGNHSKVVLLTDWMRDLVGEDVHIAGAFDGECLEDLEVALNFLGVEFNRVEELIV